MSLESMARKILPAAVRFRLKNLARRIVYFGFARYCPVCRSHLRRFATFHYLGRTRDDAQCPVCGCVERHRLIWHYLERRTDLFDERSKRMLHVGPEAGFARRLQRVKNLNYLSADIASPLAMEKMDITQIPYPDGTFDVVLCSHVLQHIPEERKAMAALFRVMKPGGWAILRENIQGEKTVEDPSAVTEDQRERAYGDPTYWRRYGADFKDRLEAVGFQVRIDAYGDEFDVRSITRLGFGNERDIHFCRKP